MNTAERLGDWSDAIPLVLITLLLKLDGGRWPIGHFPSVIGLWMRTRSVAARRWEAQNHSDDFFGGRGVRTQRAAWAAAFSNEASQACGKQVVATLLDLL